MYKCESWIDPVELKNKFSADYWNNPEEESKKIWGKVDTDFEGLENKFLKKGLFQQFDKIINEKNIDLRNKVIASLGAGIGILEAQIIRKYPKLNKVINVELSKHRIFDLAPKVAKKYKINENQMEFYFGDFTNTKIENESVDIVLLCQSYHHCDQPNNLLREVKRILKKQGIVIIIGEHYFSAYDISNRAIRHIAKKCINYRGYSDQRGWAITWKNLFPADSIKGDHHYSFEQYLNSFKNFHYSAQRFIFKEFKNQGFVLENE